VDVELLLPAAKRLSVPLGLPVPVPVLAAHERGCLVALTSLAVRDCSTLAAKPRRANTTRKMGECREASSPRPSQAPGHAHHQLDHHAPGSEPCESPWCPRGFPRPAGGGDPSSRRFSRSEKGSSAIGSRFPEPDDPPGPQLRQGW
jgi:hypothetical protein